MCFVLVYALSTCNVLQCEFPSTGVWGGQRGSPQPICFWRQNFHLATTYGDTVCEGISNPGSIQAESKVGSEAISVTLITWVSQKHCLSGLAKLCITALSMMQLMPPLLCNDHLVQLVSGQ